MILKDFYTGGFPIKPTAPVLCFSKEGEVYAAYDSSSLGNIIATKDISQVIGVWPGNKNTDCFLLSKDHYGKLKPPAGQELIDQAKSIVLIYDKGVFARVAYRVTEGEIIYSEHKALADYVIASGLQHKTIEKDLLKE